MRDGDAAQAPAVKAWFRDGIRLERYVHAPGPSQPIPPHAHEEYQFGLSRSAAGEYRLRGSRIDVPVGALRLIQSGEVHASRDFGGATPTATSLLYVSPAVVRSALDAAESADPYFPHPVAWDPALAHAFDALFGALIRESTFRLHHDEALLDILLALVRRHGGRRLRPTADGREPGAVRAIQDYLDSHLDRPISLEELAALASLSPPYLCRVFAAAVGLSPHRYQLQRRIERAKQLLAAGSSIAAAAKATGFADQSHFGRHFRRHVGVSPGRFVVERGTLRVATD